MVGGFSGSSPAAVKAFLFQNTTMLATFHGTAHIVFPVV